MLQFNKTCLQSLFTEDEFSDFNEIVSDIAYEQRLVGVIALGSMVNSLLLPKDPILNLNLNPKQLAYEKIRNRKRRKVFPAATSDMDLWICTENPKRGEDIQRTVDTRAIELIDWLVAHSELHGKPEWWEQKRKAFGEFYKQPEMYSDIWVRANNEPWMATSFKEALEREMVRYLPKVVNRINTYFQKKLPGDFLEIRAFPECVFNLRPEETTFEGVEDRSPFPRIVNEDWLSVNRNVRVLFAQRNGHTPIYPLALHGEHLGKAIADYIDA